MIVGALVLVELTAGITEASMTRKRVEPMHAELVVDDAHRVIAHHAAAARVVDGRAVLPRVIQQLVVGIHTPPGHGLGDDVFRQGRHREQAAQKSKSAEHGAAVSVLGEIARVDRRLLARVGRAHQHIAARQGPHLPRPAGDAGLVVEHTDQARLVARRGEDALHVRGRRFLQHLNRGGAQGGAVGQHARPRGEIT